MFSALLQRLDIADKIKKKAFLGKGGHDVAKSIVEGRAELGATFISEVLPVKGTKVVGPLSRELHNANTCTGAIPTRAALRDGAEALLHKLVDRRPALVGSLPAWSRRSRTADLLHGRTALPN